MNLPDYITPNLEADLETIADIIRQNKERNEVRIGTYERSYPDNIHSTTEGGFFLVVSVDHRSRRSVRVECQESYTEFLPIVRLADQEKNDILWQKFQETGQEDLERAMKEVYEKNDFIPPDKSQKPKINRVKEIVRKGVQHPNCPQCGTEMPTEPGAATGYCPSCQEGVRIPPLV